MLNLVATTQLKYVSGFHEGRLCLCGYCTFSDNVFFPKFFEVLSSTSLWDIIFYPYFHQVPTPMFRPSHLRDIILTHPFPVFRIQSSNEMKTCWYEDVWAIFFLIIVNAKLCILVFPSMVI